MSALLPYGTGGLFSLLHGGLTPPKAFVCKCPDFSCHLQGARYVIEQILSYESWMAFFKDWTLFAQAFGVTVMVSVLALLLALALGVVFGVMSTSHHTLPRFIARGYVETLQNTPLVLQAYVFYLALPYIGVMIGQVSVGIYAVGIYHGAYIAEVVRAGIQSIPKGQAEAAASQGFTYVQTMRWIILPQTIKIILPPLVNQMVNLIKNTSVIALIGGTDLMNRTNDWATTGECIYGPPFLVCGILYFILCFPLATWGRNYEERLKKRDIQSTDKPASTGEAAS